MTITSTFIKGQSHDDAIVKSKPNGCVKAIRELSKDVYEVSCGNFTLLVVVTDLVITNNGINLYRLDSDIMPR